MTVPGIGPIISSAMVASTTRQSVVIRSTLLVEATARMRRLFPIDFSGAG
jgi:hypothetical protein